MAMRWYVVQAYSGFEYQVRKSLEDRIKREGLQDHFGQILVPTEEVIEMRDGQRRKSERKFFPGYVLVQMEMDELSWHLVKNVPKVLGFIGGTPEKPVGTVFVALASTACTTRKRCFNSSTSSVSGSRCLDCSEVSSGHSFF